MSLNDWRVRFCVVESKDPYVNPAISRNTHEFIRELRQHLRYREVVGPVNAEVRFPEDYYPMLVPLKSRCAGTEEQPLYTWHHWVTFPADHAEPPEPGQYLIMATGTPTVRCSRDCQEFWTWIEPMRPLAKMQEKPPEHVANAICCETCKFFSMARGQGFLNQVTHPHAGGPDQNMKMWSDIIELEMTGGHAENSPLGDFGACAETNKLIVKYAIACDRYVAHSLHRRAQARAQLQDPAVK